MRIDRALTRSKVGRFVCKIWHSQQGRHSRLVEFDNSDPAEMYRIARDLGTSIAELRILVGHGKHAADLLQSRLQSLNVNPASIEPAVMRDLQRCCSQCEDKVLCAHELEDRPKETNWPGYCPNEQTIGALVAERKLPSPAV